MKVVFAHPTDVAHADQEAASLTGVTIRLRRLVPPGRMYVISSRVAAGIRYGFELDQLAERIVRVRPPGVSDLGTRS
jgi:hypothetical protein